uniref:Uncharacterized protein n=1 Tax=Drosophila-associated filamentous virus TaxID=2743186 RepID=A0A6M9U003_9VIRU|nr:putative protein 20 [Drosophila-associated filamentous virus]
MKLPILLYYLCVYTVKYSVSLEGSGSSEYIKDTIAEKNPVLISEHEKEIISFAEHTTENLKELNKDFVVVNVDATTQSTTNNNNYQENINSSTTILIRDTPSEDTSLPANLNTTGNDPFQNTSTTTIATLIKKISLLANVETTKDDPFQNTPTTTIATTHAIISKIISDEEKTGNDPFENVSPVEAAASLPADVEEKIKVVIDPTQSVSNLPPNNSMPYGNVITPSPPANANPLNNSTINLKSPTSNDTAPTTLPADVEKTKDDLFENAPATRISNDKKTESDPFQNTLTTTEHAIISTWLPMATTTTTTTTSKEQNGESFSNLFHLNDSQKINFVEPTTADPTQSVSSIHIPPPSNSTPYGNAINIVDPFQNSTINLKSMTPNDTDEHMRNSTTVSNLAISSQSESTAVVEITTATFGETATTAIATTTAKEASLQNKTLYLGAKKTHVNQTYSNIVEVRNQHDNVTQFSSDIRDANITNNKCAQLLAIGSKKDICDLVEVFMSNDVNVENFYDLLNNVIKRTALDLYNVYHFMILSFLFCANIIEILLIFILRKLYLCIMKRKRITLW